MTKTDVPACKHVNVRVCVGKCYREGEGVVLRSMRVIGCV